MCERQYLIHISCLSSFKSKISNKKKEATKTSHSIWQKSRRNDAIPRRLTRRYLFTSMRLTRSLGHCFILNFEKEKPLLARIWQSHPLLIQFARSHGFKI
jgi:hypothetical protein